MQKSHNKAQGTIEEPFFSYEKKPHCKQVCNAPQSSCFAWSGKKSIAQGTIEYLVILGVIMVISLSVVMYLWSSTNPEGVINEQNRLGGLNQGGLSIADALVSSDGSGLLSLTNNSEDILTITRITLNGIENDYNTKLKFYSKLLFSLSDLENACACSGNWGTTKTCNAEISYTTQDGLAKTYTYSVTVGCVQSITLTQDTNATPPIVALFDGNCNKRSAGGYFFSGSGSTSSPYGICDCNMLQDINNNLSANYILLSNINCSASINWNNGNGFEPMGTNPSPFSGSLDGNYHTINNLYIYRPGVNYIGLFKYLSGTVKNAGLSDNNITGGQKTGAIVGYSEGNIFRSYSTGSVKGTYFTGGIVGEQNSGIIMGCYSSGTISGGDYTGGISGYQLGALLNNYSTAAIIGEISGGITGDISGAVTNSFSTGTVTNSTWFDGGFAGSNFGSAANSFAIGRVSNTFNNSGFIADSEPSGGINNCYWDINGTGHEACVAYSSTNQPTCFGTTTDANGADYYFKHTNEPMASWDNGYSGSCFRNYYDSCSGTATECNTTNFTTIAACNAQGGCTASSTGDCHTWDLTNRTTCETGHEGCSFESLDCNEFVTSETCYAHAGCVFDGELNTCSGTYDGTLCNGIYYNVCNGTATECSISNFSTIATCGAQTGCSPTQNGDCHAFDALGKTVCESYEGCKGDSWTNVTGNKWCTIDGNWCICDTSALPWLAWENKSC